MNTSNSQPFEIVVPNIPTGLFSRIANDIIIAALAYNCKTKKFFGCLVEHAFRDERREIKIRIGSEVNSDDVNLPKYLKKSKSVKEFSDKQNLYNARAMFVVIRRLDEILKQIPEEGLKLKCHKTYRFVSFERSLRTDYTNLDDEIILYKDDVKIVMDVLNGHKIEELINRFGEEKVKSVIGEPADPFICQLRLDAIEKIWDIRNKARKDILNVKTRVLNRSLGLNEEDTKLFHSTEESIMADVNKKITDIWKSIGEEP